MLFWQFPSEVKAKQFWHNQVLRKLAKKYGLSRQSGDKLIMYVDDLVEVLQINLTTLEK